MKFLYTSVLAVALATLGLATPTSAVTPPDSCFAFSTNLGQVTITDYYDHESNNPINPACPRAVDIPTMLGGNPVWNIGNLAFFNKQLISLTIPSSVVNIGDSAFGTNELSSVTIPNSVTSIGNWAFQVNQLTTVSIPDSITNINRGVFYANHITSVTIPNSVTSIGSYAFMANSLSNVTLPSSITTITASAFAEQSLYGRNLIYQTTNVPHLWSSDPVEVQQAYESIWYVKLYTVDPNNPQNLQDGFMSEDWDLGWDANNNGTTADSLGGHLINPASLTLSYTSSTGNSLQSAQTFTGQKIDDVYLQNYQVTNGITMPVVANEDSPTLLEQQAIQDALSVYYRMGESVNFVPPALDGYNTPPTQTFVLGAATNNFSYVYTLPSSSAGGGGTLANTGMSEWAVIIASAVLLTAGVYPLIRRFA